MADEAIVPPKDTKPGYKTSEFWVSVVTIVLGLIGQYAGLIPEPWGTILIGMAGGGYTVSRGLAKQ